MVLATPRSMNDEGMLNILNKTRIKPRANFLKPIQPEFVVPIIPMM